MRCLEGWCLQCPVDGREQNGPALSNLTIHVQLLTERGDKIDVFMESLSELVSIEDLTANESWSGDLFFKGANLDEFVKPGVTRSTRRPKPCSDTVGNQITGNQSVHSIASELTAASG